jgi:hypothetical protein
MVFAGSTGASKAGYGLVNETQTLFSSAGVIHGSLRSDQSASANDDPRIPLKIFSSRSWLTPAHRNRLWIEQHDGRLNLLQREYLSVSGNYLQSK